MITSPIDRAGPDMNVWIWKYPLTEHSYIMSADVARGDSKDYSTFHIIDVDEGEVVAEYKGKIRPDNFASLLNEWGLLLVENEQGQLIPVLNNHLGLAIDDINAWVEATRTLAQWGSNTYIRAFGENQNDTLLAVPLFVLMGIALERSKIAEELLTSMGKLFGGAPGGLAVSVVAVPPSAQSVLGYNSIP